MAVDLRSDTISMPDQAMLESILGAKLGDDGRADSRGRGEDETANRLEDMAARATGNDTFTVAKFKELHQKDILEILKKANH